MSAGDALARIVAAKREHVAARKAALPPAEAAARARDLPPARGFARALRQADAAGRFALIAEIKRASPSKGLIRQDFDVPELARAYARGGAACLSVLTDEPFFQGRDRFLAEARAAVPLPILRKDFVLDTYQVDETRALGADAVLLIVAALEDGALAELHGRAAGLGLDVLVEVHDGAELERALFLNAALIGVNNRDLKTLQVDLRTTVELAPRVPSDRLLVAESGLRSHADLAAMRAAGARAFLVGEWLMARPDVEAATRRLLLGGDAPAPAAAAP